MEEEKRCRASFIQFNEMSVGERNANFNHVDETIANLIDPDETSHISSESMKLFLILRSRGKKIVVRSR